MVVKEIGVNVSSIDEVIKVCSKLKRSFNYEQKQEYQDYNVYNLYAPDSFLKHRWGTNTTIEGFKYMCNGAKCEIDWGVKECLDMDLVAISTIGI